MPILVEGKLTFTFPAKWHASKYDEWIHYRKQFINVVGGPKAIDILAIDIAKCCWLLEVKDYRQHPRTKVIDLADEIALKARDTIAGLVSAAIRANDAVERAIAKEAVNANNLRIVLHLEQPAKHSRLFPRAIQPALVVQRLKQLIKAIDPHPRVVDMGTMTGILWTVN